MKSSRTTNIIIAALGGEGGGMLAKWIASTAIQEGFIVQSTSVPGVAQRTGATIYYLEIFQTPLILSHSLQNQHTDKPVMSLFPTPGDVDIVIASEIIEAGRMIQRGFVTPDKTTLISSDHRVYSIEEKSTPGDGTVNLEKIINIAELKAAQFIHMDMKLIAQSHNTVISAALFGALAGSTVLPFKKESFEKVIYETNKILTNNLAAFSASFEHVKNKITTIPQNIIKNHYKPQQHTDTFKLPKPTSKIGLQLLGRISNEFANHSHEFLYLGVKRLLNYQDAAYANLYLDQLIEVAQCPNDIHGNLFNETARYLALWMCYEDIIYVSQLKITQQRFERMTKELCIKEGQQYTIAEFLRPQASEFAAICPPFLAKRILHSSLCQKAINQLTKSKIVHTNKVSGFLLFYLLSKLKPLRKRSWGYQQEHIKIRYWLKIIKSQMIDNYSLAVELSKCGRIIKGYGKTRNRSYQYISKIMVAIEQGNITNPDHVAKLREAVLKDATDKKFTEYLNEIIN